MLHVSVPEDFTQMCLLEMSINYKYRIVTTSTVPAIYEHNKIITLDLYHLI